MTELGNKLKEAREAKGLSLDDLQSLTKIQKRYLKGIEEGNYSSMPGKFYVRAFIKQYAEAVGLDTEELFSNYKEDIPSVHEEQLPEQLSRVHTQANISQGNSKLMEYLPKVLVGVLIVGTVALLYTFFSNSDGSNDDKTKDMDNSQIVNIEESKDLTEASEKDKQDQKKDEQQKNQATNSNGKADKGDENKDDQEDSEKPDEVKQEIVVVSAQGRNTTFELKNADKFELKVATTGETWVNIKNGKGTSFFQGMLTKGGTESQTFDFSKETEAVIIVGRASDTEIYINGQKVNFAVDPAKQVRQDITIRYVKTNE